MWGQEGVGNENMCFQSKEYRDVSASRVRPVCIRAQDIGEVLHMFLSGQEDISTLEDKEPISNIMVGMKVLLV